MLFRGADRSIRNNFGQTPRDLISSYVSDEKKAKTLTYQLVSSYLLT